MENYARVKLRPSTFKTSQGFLKNHIKPQIGSVPLADLTSLDLQRFYKHLLDGGFCVALVAHDCLAAIRYAKSALISWEFESFKPI